MIAIKTSKREAQIISTALGQMIAGLDETGAPEKEVKRVFRLMIRWDRELRSRRKGGRR